MRQALYTTRLQAGLGMIEETNTLLELWEEGMSVSDLQKAALQSGSFPNIAARRLRNVVAECFAPRFLSDNAAPARALKQLLPAMSAKEIQQLLLIHACRANLVLADFVRQVYWQAYSSGRSFIANDLARSFVNDANDSGKTLKPWSPSTIRRVSSYLLGACIDFGLLATGPKSTCRILPFRMESRVAGYLAYDLHFAGLSDNRVISAPEWGLFGMEPQDVTEELKRHSLRGWFIVQTAGNVSRISWSFKTMESFADELTKG